MCMCVKYICKNVYINIYKYIYRDLYLCGLCVCIYRYVYTQTHTYVLFGTYCSLTEPGTNTLWPHGPAAG